MLRVNDILPLTDFLRRAKEHLGRLKKSGRPSILTVNGKAEVVVQDAEAYQALMDQVDRAQTLEGIRVGLEQMNADQGRPAERVLDEIRRKHKIPRKA